jgi:hypothetical protein
LVLRTIYAITLECDFKDETTNWGVAYTCVPKNFRTILNDRTVTEVKGQHMLNRTNDDVKKLYIFKQSCPYLPLNVSSFFKNIDIYYVKKSNVQHVLAGDLDGFTTIRIFDVSHNPIERIKADFFNGQTSIEIVAFYECHLKIIDPKALDPLINLKEGHFDYNICINFRSRSSTYLESDEIETSIELLKSKIYENCQSHSHNSIILNPFNETLKCPKVVSCPNVKLEKVSTLSFTQKNANVIISLLVIIIIAIVAFVMKNSKRHLNEGRWNHLETAAM